MTAIELASALARIMKWWIVPQASDCEWYADILRPGDAARIRITVGGWQKEGRVTLRGLWPKFADGAEYCSTKSFDITCALARGPEAIAKDVERRLLPVYDPEFAEAFQYVKERNIRDVEASLVADRVARSIGGRVSDKNGLRRGDGIAIFDHPNAVRRLVVHPAYQDQPASVSFTAHDIDPNIAVEILNLIRASEERQAEKVRVSVPVVERDQEGEIDAILPPITKLMRVR